MCVCVITEMACVYHAFKIPIILSDPGVCYDLDENVLDEYEDTAWTRLWTMQKGKWVRHDERLGNASFMSQGGCDGNLTLNFRIVLHLKLWLRLFTSDYEDTPSFSLYTENFNMAEMISWWNPGGCLRCSGHCICLCVCVWVGVGSSLIWETWHHRWTGTAPWCSSIKMTPNRQTDTKCFHGDHFTQSVSLAARRRPWNIL